MANYRRISTGAVGGKLVCAALFPGLITFCTTMIFAVTDALAGLMLIVIAPVIAFAAGVCLGFVEHRQRWNVILCAVAATSIMASCLSPSGFIAEIVEEPHVLVLAYVVLFVLALLGAIVGVFVSGRRYCLIVATRGTCPGCGYNLRHLPRKRCPECGRWFGLDEVGLTSTDLDEQSGTPEDGAPALPAGYVRCERHGNALRTSEVDMEWECEYQEVPFDVLASAAQAGSFITDGDWHVFDDDGRRLYRVAAGTAQILLPDDSVSDDVCVRLLHAFGECGVVSGDVEIVIRKCAGMQELTLARGAAEGRVAAHAITVGEIGEACRKVCSTDATEKDGPG